MKAVLTGHDRTEAAGEFDGLSEDALTVIISEFGLDLFGRIGLFFLSEQVGNPLRENFLVGDGGHGML